MREQRITPEMRAAMRRYYKNCDRVGTDGYKWDKQADIHAIFDACPKAGNDLFEVYATYMEASAGTFLIWWSDNTQTIHNKRQYWRGTIFTRTVEDKLYVYTDICGNKLDKPRVESRAA